MIPEAMLRQIAEHSISAESRALAKQLLEAMSLPGYERLAKERDAARAENERLAKHLADLRTWAEKWSKDEERESYERRGVWRLVARQIDMLTEQPKPAGGGA